MIIIDQKYVKCYQDKSVHDWQLTSFDYGYEFGRGNFIILHRDCSVCGAEYEEITFYLQPDKWDFKSTIKYLNSIKVPRVRQVLKVTFDRLP